MTKSDLSLHRAGEIFMRSIWLQSQMSDLIILKKNPNIIQDFLSNSNTVPQLMTDQRVIYWEKMFAKVKDELKTEFASSLSQVDIDNLEALYHIRNMIAHSNVSLDRDYLLFRPSGGAAKEQIICSIFGLSPSAGSSIPMILKLNYSDDTIYSKTFALIKKLDEECFSKLAGIIGIPHSRIR